MAATMHRLLAALVLALSVLLASSYPTIDTPTLAPEANRTTEPVYTRLAPRDHDVHCKARFDAGTYAIRNGIEYLRKVEGKPALDAGDCGRVSCSYRSAILWCNDGPTRRTLPSFNNIADGAQVILDHCAKDQNRVQGWLGHPDQWRVFVEHSGDNC